MASVGLAGRLVCLLGFIAVAVGVIILLIPISEVSGSEDRGRVARNCGSVLQPQNPFLSKADCEAARSHRAVPGYVFLAAGLVLAAGGPLLLRERLESARIS